MCVCDHVRPCESSCVFSCPSVRLSARTCLFVCMLVCMLVRGCLRVDRMGGFDACPTLHSCRHGIT